MTCPHCAAAMELLQPIEFLGFFAGQVAVMYVCPVCGTKSSKLVPLSDFYDIIQGKKDGGKLR